MLPALGLLAACAGSDAYTVSITLSEDVVGKQAFIVNGETGLPIDSLVISSPDVVFKGHVSEPVLAMVMVGSYPYAQFVLEPGDITMTDEGLAKGTPANDAFSAFNDSVGTLITQMQAASEDEGFNIYKEKVVPMSVDFIVANPESPFALPVFGQVAMMLEPEQIVAVTEASPKLAADPDVKRTLDMARGRVNTSAGKKYTDFTITREGAEPQSLSQFIEPGHWTIVDFWASWCGPCRREIPVIKELYDKYKSAGLNVVGVAVKDNPDQTREAMEHDGITWPVIIADERDDVACMAYGVQSIPCILLVDPDGVIVARDLYGQQLTDAVVEAMTSSPAVK